MHFPFVALIKGVHVKKSQDKIGGASLRVGIVWGLGVPQFMSIDAHF